MALIVAAGIAVRAQRPVAQTVEPSEVASSPRASKSRLAERRSALRTESIMAGPEDSAQSADKRPAARRSVERETAAALQKGNAAARLFIVPWGEVFVDGRRRGVSPPLRVLELGPGEHKIEIRNGGFPAHTEQVAVRAGDKLTIRHRFN